MFTVFDPFDTYLFPVAFKTIELLSVAYDLMPRARESGPRAAFWPPIAIELNPAAMFLFPMATENLP